MFHSGTKRFKLTPNTKIMLIRMGSARVILVCHMIYSTAQIDVNCTYSFYTHIDAYLYADTFASDVLLLFNTISFIFGFKKDLFASNVSLLFNTISLIVVYKKELLVLERRRADNGKLYIFLKAIMSQTHTSHCFPVFIK